MARFFTVPFASAGDKSVVPAPTQGDGSVSLTQGFGPDYALDFTTDPDGLPMPRYATNGLLFDITSGIQQYQIFSIPDYVTTADTGGGPLPYSKFARVRYRAAEEDPYFVYESLIDANTNVPTVTTAWRRVDSFGQAVVYNNAAFDSGVVDGDAVFWDATGPFFAQAQAINTGAQELIGIADVTNARVYGLGYVPIMAGLTPGAVYYLDSATPGLLTNVVPAGIVVRAGAALSATVLWLNPMPEVGNSVPAGTSIDFRGFTAPAGYLLEDGSAVSRTTYSVLFSVLTQVTAGVTTNGSPIITGIGSTSQLSLGDAVEGVGIPAGSSIYSVDSPTQITLTNNATASGSPSLRIFRYGNGNGSTTFNLPSPAGRTSVASGGPSDGTLGNLPGQVGGERTHGLTSDENGPHTHPPLTGSAFFTFSPGAGTNSGGNVQFVDSTTGSSGLGTPHNNIQPSMIVTKAIKY